MIKSATSVPSRVSLLQATASQVRETQRWSAVFERRSQLPPYSEMENEAQDPNHNAALINSFCEITSSTKEEATFFLESHNWDLDAAVSTFLDDGAAMAEPPISAPVHPDTTPHSPSQSASRSYSPSLSRSPSRSRSTSPARAARAPYELRSRGGAGKKKVDKASGSRTRGVRTLADLNRSINDDSGTDSDEPQEFYTGGEKR